jgi:hypothetical protein
LLRASVGSTEAANEVVARFGVVGPKRAGLLLGCAFDTGADVISSAHISATSQTRKGIEHYLAIGKKKTGPV